MNTFTSDCLSQRTRGSRLAAGIAITSLMIAASAYAQKAPYDPPVLSCGADRTQTSLTVQVCAGASGAPSGFSLQWMTKEAYENNGYLWLDSTDDQLCKGSFSGNANLSRYNLAAGQCVTVNVGEFLFDNGCSVHGMTDAVTGESGCDDGLKCGTDYVFRGFSHGDKTRNRSNFTANLVCGTEKCYQESSCTYTQGYWKTHGPVEDGLFDCQTGNNADLWASHELMLGDATYQHGALCTVLNTAAKGNGLIALAHQLIAAKLNIANGASVPNDVDIAIQAADDLIGQLVVGGTWTCPTKGSCTGNYLSPGATSGLTTQLMNYNEGLTGPGHCQEPVDPLTVPGT